MNPRNIIQSAFVIVVGFIAVAVFGLTDPEEPRVIADEKPAVNEGNKTENLRDGFSPYVDKDGNISLPKGYRQNWTHLGSWAVAKKRGQAIHEMHNVYTQPETIVAYNNSGVFPDGAVLVKEVHATKAKRLTTGHSA